MTDSTPSSKWDASHPDIRGLGNAKQLVLEMLWGMQWVEGRDIFERVNQTYYDRRIRELRESGWDIETSGTKYRLRSHEKAKGQVRTYPSTQQKKRGVHS